MDPIEKHDRIVDWVDRTARAGAEGASSKADIPDVSIIMGERDAPAGDGHAPESDDPQGVMVIDVDSPEFYMHVRRSHAPGTPEEMPSLIQALLPAWNDEDIARVLGLSLAAYRRGSTDADFWQRHARTLDTTYYAAEAALEAFDDDPEDAASWFMHGPAVLKFTPAIDLLAVPEQVALVMRTLETIRQDAYA